MTSVPPPFGWPCSRNRSSWLVEPQWSAATWLSVGRRSVVLAGIFGLGLLTVSCPTAIFLPGALQLRAHRGRPYRGRNCFQLLAVNVVVTVPDRLGLRRPGRNLVDRSCCSGALAFVSGANVASGLPPMITEPGFIDTSP